MRRIFALALIVSFGAGCNAQPPANNAAVSVVHSDMEPVTLKAFFTRRPKSHCAARWGGIPSTTP